MGVFVGYVAFFIWGCVSLSVGEMTPLNMEACEIGDVVQNECTKCTCTVRHVYECTAKPCKRSKAEDFKKVSKKGKTCQPHKIYHQLSTICICREDGSWPHESCYTTFKALPEARIVKKKCTGSKYVIIGCNICMCNIKGEIESQRCTQNDCDDDPQIDHRRKTKSSHVYGNCLAKNWYSLAPCQFCYCLNNNKLMCNTGNVNVKGIELGSYNFSLCGPDYLKEALEFAETSDTKGSLRVAGDIKTTTKPRKHKAEDIQELFAKSDEERMQQKKTEKKTPVAEHKKSHKKPIEKEKNRQTSDENGSNEHSDSDDKSDKDDDTEDNKKITMTQNVKNYKIDSVEEMVKQSHVKHKQASSDEKEDNDDDEDDDESTFDIGAAFIKTIPTIKKIFDVRRTVVLNSQTKCEPGTLTMVECNTCHCLKNGKLLCTDKKCN